MNGWSTPRQQGSQFSGSGAGGTSDYYGGQPSQPAPPVFGQQPTFGQQPAYGQPPAYQPPGFGPPPGFGNQPPKSGMSSTKIGLIIGGVVLALLVGFGILFAVFVGSISDGVFDGLETGYTYGDNATLDGLWDQCAAGNFESCDTLYLRSELDSDYEAFGDSCGRRNEPAGFCASIYDGN